MKKRHDSLRDLVADERRSLFTLIRKRLAKMFRSPWHKCRFRSFGTGSRVDYPAEVIGARAIEIGDRVTIRHSVRLEAHFASEGEIRLRIGDATQIAPYVHIGSAKFVEIGSRCGIGSFTWITDHDHDVSDPAVPVTSHSRVVIAPTVIEDGVYIGERVAVLRGVRIGRGSVIGTNSVVVNDVPPYSVAVGSPARVIRRYDPILGDWVSFAE
jgi:lipopolysaccharide O-acetyltransferase